MLAIKTAAPNAIDNPFNYLDVQEFQSATAHEEEQ